MSKKNRIRIYVQTELFVGQKVICDDKQSHYLLNVMRLKIGDEIYVFNGKDGEYCAKIESVYKKTCELNVSKKYGEYVQSPDVWLLFAPLKKDNTDFVVEKATELGVRRLIPIITEYTSNLKPRTERLKLQVIEASEQCRRQDIPEVSEAETLQKTISSWDTSRKLVYLDESMQSKPIKEQIQLCNAPIAILVGPEGGFSEKELEILRKLDYSYGVSLGKRILRAETAAIAAIAIWQSCMGDWS